MSTTDGSSTAVIGAGTMGYGIALGFALGGQRVSLYDVDREMLETARDRILNGLAIMEDARAISSEERTAALDRIEYERSLSAAVRNASLVTEAVPEDIETKREVFTQLSTDAPGDAILASNTSGLSITDIAEVVTDPSRVLGTHYFNPAHIVPVVEVVRGSETADEAVTETMAFLERIGKTPVPVGKDIPGFIVNRIQSAMMYEAEALVDRGIATPADIDRAVRGSFGIRMPVLGLFEVADLEGLDVHLDVMEYLLDELDRGTAPHPFLEELVAEEKLGLKSGEGIYEWGDDEGSVLSRRDESLLEQVHVYENSDGLAADSSPSN